MVWAWAVGSLLAVLGAGRPPGRRRRWYVAYTTMWVAAVVACVAGLAVLEHVDIRDRWVSTYYGTPGPQDWRDVWVEPAFHRQLPVAITITNPLIVLLAFRLLSGRALEGVEERRD